jgi:hypothetical protein
MEPRRTFTVIRFIAVVLQIKEMIFTIPVEGNEISGPAISGLKEDRHQGILLNNNPLSITKNPFRILLFQYECNAILLSCRTRFGAHFHQSLRSNGER